VVRGLLRAAPPPFCPLCSNDDEIVLYSTVFASAPAVMPTFISCEERGGFTSDEAREDPAGRGTGFGEGAATRRAMDHMMGRHFAGQPQGNKVKKT